MAKLTTLNLGATRIGDDGLASLAGLTGLQFLAVFDTAVTDKGVAHLDGLTHLKTLYLNRTAVTDKGLEALAGCPTWTS